MYTPSRAQPSDPTPCLARAPQHPTNFRPAPLAPTRPAIKIGSRSAPRPPSRHTLAARPVDGKKRRASDSFGLRHATPVPSNPAFPLAPYSRPPRDATSEPPGYDLETKDQALRIPTPGEAGTGLARGTWSSLGEGRMGDGGIGIRLYLTLSLPLATFPSPRRHDQSPRTHVNGLRVRHPVSAPQWRRRRRCDVLFLLMVCHPLAIGPPAFGAFAASAPKPQRAFDRHHHVATQRSSGEPNPPSPP